MAKDIYRDLSVIELNGTLDKTDDNEYVVFVEMGKDSPPMPIDLMNVLENCCGRQITMKLTSERVL